MSEFASRWARRFATGLPMWLRARAIVGLVQRGDIVDDFTLDDQQGRPVMLSSLLANGPVVLFFYVKAMTSG